MQHLEFVNLKCVTYAQPIPLPLNPINYHVNKNVSGNLHIFNLLTVVVQWSMNWNPGFHATKPNSDHQQTKLFLSNCVSDIKSTFDMLALDKVKPDMYMVSHVYRFHILLEI